MNADLLVIGYGNELRRDDGVGPRVARAAADWQQPGLEAIAAQQLTPELSERLARAQRVVFVDAGLDAAAALSIQPIAASSTARGLGHTGDPRELLALTAALHGRQPEAWLITVPITNLDFGEELSACAARGLQAALQLIRRLAGMEEQPCTKSA